MTTKIFTGQDILKKLHEAQLSPSTAVAPGVRLLDHTSIPPPFSRILREEPKRRVAPLNYDVESLAGLISELLNEQWWMVVTVVLAEARLNG